MILRTDHPDYFNPRPINGERFARVDVLGTVYLFSDHGRMINERTKKVLRPQTRTDAGTFVFCRKKNGRRINANFAVRRKLKEVFGIETGRKRQAHQHQKSAMEWEYLDDKFSVDVDGKQFVYF